MSLTEIAERTEKELNKYYLKIIYFTLRSLRAL